MNNNPFVRCDGVHRRHFIRVGALSAFGATLFNGRQRRAVASSTARARQCILIWLDGGPSHLETFDLKPDAPQEVRGPFQPVPTRVPGTQICELMPKTAEIADRISIIRSMTSPLGEHNFGTHYMMTGYRPTPVLEYPTFGSVVAHQRNESVLPGHIAIPSFRVGGGRLSGNGFLPAACKPFSVGGDPAKPNFTVRDLDFFPGVNASRLQRRQTFLKQLDSFGRKVEANQPVNPEFEQAYRLVTSTQAKNAFDLGRESPAMRSSYGRRTIGQCCLLARRLIERGVPFVTVNNPGWDTHQNAYTRLKEGYTGAQVPVGLVPTLDTAFARLVTDLAERGLLETTLVVVMGEFGRTPKLNTSGGRDHWPRVFSVAMAGGGITGGSLIGQSDSVGESPKDRPVTPADLTATIYTLLGMDPRQELVTPDGRPVQLNQGGTPITEAVS